MTFLTLGSLILFNSFIPLVSALLPKSVYPQLNEEMSLRQYYGLQYDSSIPGNYKPTGPNLLDAGMNPVNYTAYSRLLFPW